MFVAICISLVRCLFRSLAHFFVGLVFCWVGSFKCFRYFGYESFIRYVFCKYFLLVCGFFPHSLDSHSQSSFSFLWGPLYQLFLSWIVPLMLNLESSPNPVSPRFSPVLFYKSFVILLLFTFRFVIHWINFCERGRSVSFLCMWASSCSSTICWKYVVYILHGMAFSPLSRIVDCNCRFTPGLSAPLVHWSVISAVPHCIDYCGFILSLEFGDCLPLLLLLYRLFWVFCSSIL